MGGGAGLFKNWDFVDYHRPMYVSNVRLCRRCPNATPSKFTGVFILEVGSDKMQHSLLCKILPKYLQSASKYNPKYK